MDFQQTDSAANCTPAAFCSGLTFGGEGTTAGSRLATVGGTPGSVEVEVTPITASGETTGQIFFELPVPAGITWAGGTWTVRVNITTSTNVAIDLDEVHICRVNSSCVSQESLGSTTGIGASLQATGVISVNVTCSATTPAAGDKIMIVIGVTSTLSATPDPYAFTPDQIITSSLVDAQIPGVDFSPFLMFVDF